MLAMEAGAREMQGECPCSLSTFPYIWGSHTAVGPDELEKNLEAGGLQSRGQTFNACPEFLFCALVSGVDYKSSKKRTTGSQVGEMVTTLRHDAGDSNGVGRDDSRQCELLDEYLYTNLAAETSPDATPSVLNSIFRRSYLPEKLLSSQVCL